MFRVTYDAETDNVWFQTSLAQRKGSFGTTAGGDQVRWRVKDTGSARYRSIRSPCITSNHVQKYHGRNNGEDFCWSLGTEQEKSVVCTYF